MAFQATACLDPLNRRWLHGQNKKIDKLVELNVIYLI